MNRTNYKIYTFSKNQKIKYFFIYTFSVCGAGYFLLENIYISAGAAALLVPVLIRRKAASLKFIRDKRIRNSFCDALQIMSVYLSAGMNFRKALCDTAGELKKIYGKNSELIEEFYFIKKRIFLNHNIGEILGDLAARTGSHEIRSFSEAAVVCTEAGGSIGEIVKNIYTVILQKTDAENEIEAICSRQKISLKILAFMPIAVMALMKFISPEYISVLLKGPWILVMSIPLGSIIISYFIGESIISGKTKKSVNKKCRKGFKDNGAVHKTIKKCLGYLKKYNYERNFQIIFEEIYESNGEKYYVHHRVKQLCASLALVTVCILTIILFGVKWEMIFVILALMAAILYLPDKKIWEKAVERRKRIDEQMPEFMTELAVLTDAGITIKAALKKIALEMSENELSRQLELLVKDFSYGISDEACFENFALRCKTKETSSFSSLVLQNLKKGGREFSAVLRIHAKSSWDKKRMDAKITGEERAAKLMFPTMMIFISLMFIMAAPAIININLL